MFLCVAVRDASGQVSITAGFDTSKWIAPRQAIELRIQSGALPDSARVAVLAGTLDVSALFRLAGGREIARFRLPHLAPFCTLRTLCTLA